MLAYILLCIFIVWSNIWLYGKIYFFFFPKSGDFNPDYYIDDSTISVSGFSSGGTFAEQFGLAFSKRIAGVGIFSGVPYFCSENDGERIADCLAGINFRNIQYYVDKLSEFEKNNLIDNTEHIKKQKIFLFHSKKDEVVAYENMKLSLELYSYYIDEGNIEKRDSFHISHAFPTNTYGDGCDEKKATKELGFMKDCDYDLSGDMLKFFYPDITNRVNDISESSNLYRFTQREKYPGFSFAEDGFIYIPKKCQIQNENLKQKCHLHVHFHGCLTSHDEVGSKYIHNIGLNQWAENNNIIMLYPQITKEENLNQLSCWDWFGMERLGKENFATKDGTQMSAVNNMITDLLTNEFYHFKTEYLDDEL